MSRYTEMSTYDSNGNTGVGESRYSRIVRRRHATDVSDMPLSENRYTRAAEDSIARYDEAESKRPVYTDIGRVPDGLDYAGVEALRNSGTSYFGNERRKLDRYGIDVGFKTVEDYASELSFVSDKIAKSTEGKYMPSYSKTPEYKELKDYQDQLEARKRALERVFGADSYKTLASNDDFEANSTRPEGRYGQRVHFANEYFNNEEFRKMAVGDIVSEAKTWAMATDEERKTFNYILNTQGEEAAKKYLDDMDIHWGRAADTAAKTEISAMSDAQLAKENASGLLSHIAGAAGYIENAFGTITGQGINPYSPVNRIANRAEYANEEAQRRIDQKGKLDIAGHDLLSTLYSGVYSAAQSYGGAKMFGKAYLPIMGMSAARAESKKLYEEGASDAQIIAGSTLAGIAEMLFEKYSFDKFLDGTITPKNLGVFLKQAGLQGAVEASEEIFTEGANQITDYIVRGGASDSAKLYYQLLADGKTEKEASARVALDIADKMVMAGVTGFIAGGIGSAGGQLGLKVNDHIQTRETGRKINTYGDSSKIIATAEELGVENKALTDYLNKVAVGETVSDYQTGKAYNAAYEAIADTLLAGDAEVRTNTTKIITDQLKNMSVDEKTAGKIAEAVVKSIAGETITSKQGKLLKTEAGQQILTEINQAFEDPDSVPWFKPALEFKSENHTKGEEALKTYSQVLDSDARLAAQAEGEVGRKFSATQHIQIDSVKQEGGSLLIKREGETKYTKVKAEEITSRQGQMIVAAEEIGKQYGQEASDAFIALANGETKGTQMTTLANAFALAYEYGKNGYSMDDAVSKTSGTFSEAQALTAYKAGNQYRLAHAQTKAEAIAKQIAANPKKGQGSFTVDVDNKTLRSLQRGDSSRKVEKTLGILEAISKRGVNVEVYDGGIDAKQDAHYDAETNTISVDIRAGLTSKTVKNVILPAMSHEMTHFLKVYAPVEYEALSEFVIDALAKESEIDSELLVQNELSRLEKAHPETKYDLDDAREELVARACEDMLTNSEHMYDMLVKQNDSFKKKFKDALNRGAKTIKQFLLDTADATSDKQEAKWLRRDAETFAKSVEMWNAAIDKAFENSSSAGVLESEEGTTEKYRDRESDTDDYMAAVEAGNTRDVQKMVDVAAVASGALTDRNGKPVHFYHGTRSRKFNSFSLRRAGMGWSGYGYYFSKSSGFAGSYGDNIVDAYILTDNLAHDYDHRITEEDIQKFLSDMGYEQDGIEAQAIGLGFDARSYSEIARDLKSGRIRPSGINYGDRNTLLNIENILVGSKKMSVEDALHYIRETFGYDGVDSARETVLFDNSLMKSAEAVTYDDNGEVIPLSERFDTRNSDIRYADRVVESAYETLGETDRVQKRIDLFNQDVDILREMIANGAKVSKGERNPEQMAKVARGLRDLTHSTMSIKEITEALTELYSYMDSKPGIHGNEFFAAAQTLGRTLMDTSKQEYTNAEIERLLGFFKKTPFSLSLAQKQEANYKYGDYNGLRSAIRGKVKISPHAIPLDELWSTICGTLPGLFDPETNPGDMLNAVLSTIDKYSETQEYVAQFNQNEFLHELALRMYEGYFDVAFRNTRADQKFEALKKKHQAIVAELYASFEGAAEAQKIAAEADKAKAVDKIKRELESTRARQQKELEAVRESMQRKTDRIVGPAIDDIARYRQEVRDLRDKVSRVIATKNAKIAEAKRQGSERLADYKLEQKRGEIIGAIRSDVMELIKAFDNNNPKKLYVNKHIEEPLARFLQSFNMLSLNGLGANWGHKRNGAMTKKDIRFKEAVAGVKTMLIEYEAKKLAAAEEDSSVDLVLPPVCQEAFNSISETLERYTGDEELVLEALSATQLDNLRRAVKAIKTSLNKMNKMINNAHYQDVRDAAHESIDHFMSMRRGKYAGGKVDKFFEWGNTTPVMAFERFGAAGKSLFKELTDGQAKMARLTKEISDFTESLYTEEEITKWRDTIVKCRDRNGRTFRMTIPQIMALYATYGRDQAQTHLFGEGIKIAEFKHKGETIDDNISHTMNASDYAAIFANLDARQKEVATALQKFMAETCAEWGNEVSNTLWGIDMFTEPDYFTLITSDDKRGSETPTDKNKSIYRLANLGFTNALVKNANNALVIDDIFNIFITHATDMSMYSSMLIPVLDNMKWYNYYETNQRKGETQREVIALKAVMTQAFGKNANTYFTELMRDLNGNSTAGRDETTVKKMISRYKSAAVGANLRVAVLQPTSYVRALAVLKASSLAKAFGNMDNIKRAKGYYTEAYKEACEHNGIALWKSMGYFDMNLGRPLGQKLMHEEGFIDKASDVLMKGAELGDAVTWGILWSACKAEVEPELKGVKKGSDEYWQIISDKFDEVIYKTQVVDSTLTRSQYMRNKGATAQVSTAFMSEPTISYNLVGEAAMKLMNDSRNMGRKKAWDKNKKMMGKVMLAHMMTAALSALVESLVDAGRKTPKKDDEDEEGYWARVMDVLWDNFSGDVFIPLPWIKDVINIAKGYSANRMELQWLQDGYYFAKSLGHLIKADKYADGIKTFKNGTKFISEASGIPAYGLTREAVAFWNTFIVPFGAEPIEW